VRRGVRGTQNEALVFERLPADSTAPTAPIGGEQRRDFMSWANCVNAQGRPCGYAVIALCDQPGCLAPIDRGLSYACGGFHDGGEDGCGGYFCSEHLGYGFTADEEERMSAQLCPACVAAYEAT